jgi:hypothetical protein
MYSTATQLGGLLGLSVLGTVMVNRVASVLPVKLASAGVPTALACQLQGHAAAIAQGVVPVAGNLPASTAHAVTAGAYSAFASGLDLAMLLTAAVVLAVGLVTLGLMRPKRQLPQPQPTGTAVPGPPSGATPATSLSQRQTDGRAFSDLPDRKEQYMSGTGSPYADTSHMYKAHTMFRREFGLLPDLVRSVPDKDKERALVVAGHVKLVSLVLHEHHSGEDEVLWPLLLTRAPKEIAPVILLGTWTAGAASDDGEVLAFALERLAVALYEHMGLEEKLVLPLAERHIFASEWDKLVADGAASIPPETGPVLAGMLMYEGGPDVVPPQMRAVLAELAPQAYAAHSERVHGTPAPPHSTEIGIGTPHVGVARR